jgi:hypothetical protein
VRGEIIKQVTAIKLELTAADGQAMYKTLHTLFDQIGVSEPDDRPKRPDLAPFYHMYDILKEAGFDQ